MQKMKRNSNIIKYILDNISDLLKRNTPKYNYTVYYNKTTVKIETSEPINIGDAITIDNVVWLVKKKIFCSKSDSILLGCYR